MVKNLTGWEIISLLIFLLAAGFGDKRNPYNASLPIWLQKRMKFTHSQAMEKNKFGLFLVVVQLIHSLMQADISCSTTARLFFFPLLANTKWVFALRLRRDGEDRQYSTGSPEQRQSKDLY